MGVLRAQRNCVLNAIGVVAVLLGILGLTSPAGAAVITATGYRLFLSNQSANTVGVPSGQTITFDVLSVTPNFSGGTRGQVSTNSGANVYPFSDNSSPLAPNSIHGSAPYNPSLIDTDPWTFTLTNPCCTSPAPVDLSFPAGTALLPYANSVAVSGTSATPIFNWHIPGSIASALNGVRIQIYDKNAGGLVSGISKPPTTTSFTIDAAAKATFAAPYDPSHSYAIEIILLQTRIGDGTPYNASGVFFDWNPSDVSALPVYLPVTDPFGFSYDMQVVAGQTYYIDPTVAIGYDFQIGEGDPNFASVLLPTGIGDNFYDIYGFNGNNPFLLAGNWLGGIPFDFLSLFPGGIDRFRVLGIETSAGLDPSDTTAFVTGLTFTADGEFTGTQTPITADVPEPGTLLLFASGLFGLVTLRRRTQQRIPTA